MMISTSDSIIRLVVAIILGGLIGYEREARSQSAGLRTHILVCLGACLCMIISINIALDFYSVYGYTRSDPERIAAQVISGVGFLGAGTILANQKGHSVKGLTTAASIWGVAAVGLVVGCGAAICLVPGIRVGVSARLPVVCRSRLSVARVALAALVARWRARGFQLLHGGARGSGRCCSGCAGVTIVNGLASIVNDGLGVVLGR